MSYAPARLRELRAYLASETGLGLASLGIVGDRRHTAGYHLGADRLRAGDYSAATARDRAGLTDAASAIDIGSWPGLRPMSRYLVNAARVNAPGTRDLREIIYTPDGRTVLRWDRERGYSSAPRPGEADASHLTHTHVSWYRDAEGRDHTTPFRPYFSPEVDPMSKLYNAGGRLISLAVGEPVYAEPGDTTPVGTIGEGPGDGDGSTIYRVLTFDRWPDPQYALVDGGGEGKLSRWIRWP